MDFIDIILYFSVCALGGAINAVAGGGTFLTFPLLMLGGLSPLAANVMSTIALWPGSVASSIAYRKHLNAERAQLTEFIGISLVGSVIGTTILLLLPEATFSSMVPWLLLFATLIFAFGERWHVPAGNKTVAYALQFFIAIYGGYFGAGQGILMLAMLQLLGFSDIHRMNALKVVLGSVINAAAVVMFILANKVIWELAPMMIAGGIAGGWLGAHGALKVHPKIVRRFVIVTGALMTMYFFAKSA